MLLRILPLLLLLVSNAEAHDRNGQISVGGGAGFVVESPWAEKSFRQSVGFGPKLSAFARFHQETNYLGLELSADYFQMSERSLASRSLSLGFFWRFLPFEKLHPIVSIGTGISKMQSFYSTGNSAQPIVRLRAGAEWELNSRTDLFFHLEHISVVKGHPRDPSLHVLAPSVGLIVYFLDPPALPPPPASTSSGKPTSTASPVTDNDSDGVSDELDLCPGTSSGKVNAAGCAQGQSFSRNLEIRFPAGSAQISQSNESILAGLGRVLAANPDLKIEIQAHTDSRDGKRKKISQSRADAVKKILVKKYGVSGSRITAKGYGDSQPVDTNNNPDGRANNARIIAVMSR